MIGKSKASADVVQDKREIVFQTANGTTSTSSFFLASEVAVLLTVIAGVAMRAFLTIAGAAALGLAHALACCLALGAGADALGFAGSTLVFPLIPFVHFPSLHA